MNNPIATRKILGTNRLAITWIVGTVWLGLVIAGTVLMVGYANTPGEADVPPSKWPDSSQVIRNLKLPTLIVFIHPHCPCSVASIGELALLMAHSQGKVDAHVFFLQPAGMSVEWTETDTWTDASQIPGVAVHRDVKGQEARLFHAQTSGQIVLYDAEGSLVFHGGITGARGHSGDNAGRDAVQALLFHEPATQSSTPVFGCSLFECKAAVSSK